MILELIQESKELFSARFRLEQNGREIGRLQVESGPFNPYGRITGSVFGRSFEMHRARNGRKADYQPYEIEENRQSSGLICTVETGRRLSRSGYTHMECWGKDFRLYPVHMGAAGAKFPVYFGSEQIALVKKPCEVKDDLHCYTILATEESRAYAALFFTAYHYVSRFYRSGESVTGSLCKTTTVTTDPELTKMYDPAFEARWGKEEDS